MTTLVVAGPSGLTEHDGGPRHPERPSRLVAVMEGVRALGPESVGASVRLTLRRGGEPVETILTIGERPESQ